MSSRRHLSIHPIAGSLGAEIHDINFTELGENPGLVKEIREALLQHQVIFFRNQNLDAKGYLKFTSYFGSALPR